MKFNEPVRPAGIGRKQVAFDTGQKPSLLSLTVEAENTQTAPESTEAQNIATMVQATKLAKVAAYSAASSAIVQGQNEVWGVGGIDEFTVDPTNGGYVKWSAKGSLYEYNRKQINNPFMFVSTEEPSKIFVNKPGWWLVDALIAVTNYKNSQNYILDVLSGSGDDYILGFDSLHTNQYPTLRLNALVPVPSISQFAGFEPYEWPPYLQVRLRIPGLGSSQLIQADGYIHAIWMKPWETNESHGIA